MLSQKFLASVAVIAMLAAPNYSSAQSILWDQQPDTTLTTVIDLDIPAPQAGFSTYLVNDATFTSACLLYTSPSPRDKRQSRMPSSA